VLARRQIGMSGHADYSPACGGTLAICASAIATGIIISPMTMSDTASSRSQARWHAVIRPMKGL